MAEQEGTPYHKSARTPISPPAVEVTVQEVRFTNIDAETVDIWKAELETVVVE